ncbi:hypothetical protein ACUNV4_28725 [Granulosicoccus sp. 3-233]|uniref:hypothetical protein n=1 Tax=Granulosicoccus sp. 3-233 TaxID=3417969 RepID=UPI003D34A899
MMIQDSEQAVSPISAEEVTLALNGILTTDKFAASPQMSAFLKYVVEQTLIGNTRRIKAFTVGIEALGKPASFDPQTDPSVRVLAKRLRSSLETYYVQNPDTTVFIEMKPGSYVPKFLLRSEMKKSPTAQQAPSYQDTAPHTSTTTSSPAPQGETNDAVTENQSDRNTGINQLWQAYKTASKVA